LGQRAAHSDAFRAAKWIGAHAPGTAAHREVRMLVEEVEDQLERCPEAVNDHRPILVEVGARMPEAVRPKSIPAAPARIGALCLSLVAGMLAKLRQGEQQALH
jgi:hypothetical protein